MPIRIRCSSRGEPRATRWSGHHVRPGSLRRLQPQCEQDSRGDGLAAARRAVRTHRVELLRPQGLLFLPESRMQSGSTTRRDGKPSFRRALGGSATNCRRCFSTGSYDEVYLAYNAFHIAVFPDSRWWSGCCRSDAAAALPKARDASADAILGAAADRSCLAILLPRLVNLRMFFALLSNAAGEHGARMTAMDNATSNADKLIDELHAAAETGAAGEHHEGTDRNRRRRRSAEVMRPASRQDAMHERIAAGEQ